MSSHNIPASAPGILEGSALQTTPPRPTASAVRPFAADPTLEKAETENLKHFHAMKDRIVGPMPVNDFFRNFMKPEGIEGLPDDSFFDQHKDTLSNAGKSETDFVRPPPT